MSYPKPIINAIGKFRYNPSNLQHIKQKQPLNSHALQDKSENNILQLQSLLEQLDSVYKIWPDEKQMPKEILVEIIYTKQLVQDKMKQLHKLKIPLLQILSQFGEKILRHKIMKADDFITERRDKNVTKTGQDPDQVIDLVDEDKLLDERGNQQRQQIIDNLDEIKTFMQFDREKPIVNEPQRMRNQEPSFLSAQDDQQESQQESEQEESEQESEEEKEQIQPRREIISEKKKDLSEERSAFEEEKSTMFGEIDTRDISKQSDQKVDFEKYAKEKEEFDKQQAKARQEQQQKDQEKLQEQQQDEITRLMQQYEIEKPTKSKKGQTKAATYQEFTKYISEKDKPKEQDIQLILEIVSKGVNIRNITKEEQLTKNDKQTFMTSANMANIILKKMEVSDKYKGIQGLIDYIRSK